MAILKNTLFHLLKQGVVKYPRPGLLRQPGMSPKISLKGDGIALLYSCGLSANGNMVVMAGISATVLDCVGIVLKITRLAPYLGRIVNTV